MKKYEKPYLMILSMTHDVIAASGLADDLKVSFDAIGEDIFSVK